MEWSVKMPNKTVYLIHGFNVSDGGNGTTDKFVRPLNDRGYHVIELDYGHIGGVVTKLCDRKMARMVARMAEPGSVIIGHSNGCTISCMAAQYGAKFSQMVWINPALDVDVKIGTYVNRVHVWYNQDDLAVTVASWIPGVMWGEMGAVGYKGKDPRVVNYNVGRNGIFPRFPVKGHSDIFTPLKFKHYSPVILDKLEQ